MPETVSDSQMKPADIGLLLRAHAELRCLSREVLPVLRQIETGADLPEEQFDAALAYLEVTWIEASRRAVETDAARLALGEPSDRGHGLPDRGHALPDRGHSLSDRACRYCAAVRRLRRSVATRVGSLLASPELSTPGAPVIRRLGDDGREAGRASSGGASAPAHGSL